jgi:ElaB/YqjD/DUF883 family membrane-anchored ribosome-binding protein
MNRTEHEGNFEIGQMSERERRLDRSRATGPDGGQNVGRKADSIFKQIKTTAADKLQTAAQTLHQKADRSGQPAEVSALGHRAADWLERSADYLSEMEPQRLKTDIEDHVRRNPGRSLLIAGIVGLTLGGLLRKR